MIPKGVLWYAEIPRDINNWKMLNSTFGSFFSQKHWTYPLERSRERLFWTQNWSYVKNVVRKRLQQGEMGVIGDRAENDKILKSAFFIRFFPQGTRRFEKPPWDWSLRTNNGLKNK